MKNQRQINKELRYYNRKNYYLLFLCLFLSELLITAYAVMMQSPTVLTILPEGGDSRKQVSMIFFLAVFGCGVFVVYAAALFLKYKSRETGRFRQAAWGEAAAGAAVGFGHFLFGRHGAGDAARLLYLEAFLYFPGEYGGNFFFHWGASLWDFCLLCAGMYGSSDFYGDPFYQADGCDCHCP